MKYFHNLDFGDFTFDSIILTMCNLGTFDGLFIYDKSLDVLLLPC